MSPSLTAAKTPDVDLRFTSSTANRAATRTAGMVLKMDVFCFRRLAASSRGHLYICGLYMIIKDDKHPLVASVCPQLKRFNGFDNSCLMGW